MTPDPCDDNARPVNYTQPTAVGSVNNARWEVGGGLTRCAWIYILYIYIYIYALTKKNIQKNSKRLPGGPLVLRGVLGRWKSCANT